MNISLAFTRVFFFILSIFFMTVYMASSPLDSMPLKIGIGVGLGIVFGLLLVAFDTVFKRFNLRAFNIAVVGMFIGFLMGEALLLIFQAILDISSISIAMQPQTLEIIKIALFLFGVYLGTIMTLRGSDELYISIPFVKLAAVGQQKKDLLVDLSLLSDPRVIDIATSGLLDGQLVLPRFLIKELYAQSELGKRPLENIKKLESLETLHLRYNDTDFPDVKEINGKIFRLARLLDANILTAEMTRVSATDGVRVININALSTALKPQAQTGEVIRIKIQRYGKEPRQGVGYLDDGTMVVVNGGGKYLGETIDAKVLSVKHTTSGRMIFSNAPDFEDGEEDDE